MLSGRLDNAVCVVTGGGSGIGAAAAVAMASAGASAVVIAGRRGEEGRRVAAECRKRGAEAVFQRTDVSVDDDVAALTLAVVERFGSLDVAFLNAGVQEARRPLADQNGGVFDQIFNVNVKGTFQCLRHQVPIMVAQGKGSIVVNTSVSGIRNPNVGLSLYSASKAAVLSLVRSAALEYGPHGVRVNAVAPGRVVTEMMLQSGVGSLEAVGAALPIRRMGSPDEVANAVVWLASDDASYVTGAILPTDGGFLAS